MCQLVAIACAVGCCAGCEGESTTGPEARVHVVRYTTPESRDVTDYAYFTGRFEAVQSVDIQARATGFLVGIDFTSGTEVKKDQRLFKVDPRPYQAQLDQAEGQVQLMEAKLKLADADLARAQEVAKTPGAISQQDLDTYVASQAEATASLIAAKANAEVARLNLEFTDVMSPLDGLVGRNLIDLGNLVHQDETLLTTVVSQDPIYCYFDVDEHTLLSVQRLIQQGVIKRTEDGDVPIDVGLADEGAEYPHSGTVNFVDNQVDPSTGTMEVRGVLKNPKINDKSSRLFIPGEFVRVRLPIGPPHPSLVVPQAAINSEQADKYLLVVDDKNVVEERPVTLGAEQPAGMQVVVPVQVVRDGPGVRPANEGEQGFDSVTARDRVVVVGLQAVRPGDEVAPRPLDKTDAEVEFGAQPANAP